MEDTGGEDIGMEDTGMPELDEQPLTSPFAENIIINYM